MSHAPVTIISRIKWALVGAAAGAGLGLIQPPMFYILWSVMHPHGGGQDWSGLVPIVLATIGMFGGGAVGLLVGGVLPGLSGIAPTIAGLALIHAGSLIFFVATSMEPALFAWILVPSTLFDGLLAFWIWPRRSTASMKEA